RYATAGSGQLDCLRFELFGKSFSRLLHLVSGLSTGPGIYRTSGTGVEAANPSPQSDLPAAAGSVVAEFASNSVGFS
ncbi:MAG: hypothetical protein ACI8UO_006597, partial [Verrucomicrobiales bacterium]